MCGSNNDIMRLDGKKECLIFYSIVPPYHPQFHIAKIKHRFRFNVSFIEFFNKER